MLIYACLCGVIRTCCGDVDFCSHKRWASRARLAQRAVKYQSALRRARPARLLPAANGEERYSRTLEHRPDPTALDRSFERVPTERDRLALLFARSSPCNLGCKLLRVTTT